MEKQTLIDLFLKEQVLSFGSFTLKSGRTSSYFFNLGQLCSGQSLSILGDFYAQAIIDSGIKFNSLFGPAYKGIPLVTTTAIALARKTQAVVPFGYNRKETKDHGEGGELVGLIQSPVIVIDDVITAGATAKACIDDLTERGIKIAAWVVAMDRQEPGPEDDSMTASEWLHAETGVQVVSLLSLNDIVSLSETGH